MPGGAYFYFHPTGWTYYLTFFLDVLFYFAFGLLLVSLKKRKLFFCLQKVGFVAPCEHKSGDDGVPAGLRDLGRPRRGPWPCT